MYKATTPLRISMQHFAEGGDPPPAAPPAAPAGDDSKTYTADYVRALRQEAKDNRIKASGFEKSIRTALGLKDDEDIGDIGQRLTAREAATLKAANDRLIAAELKALGGYDHKLLAKLIDLSAVKVDEQGNVTGIKEAAEAAAKEYPVVLKDAPPPADPKVPGSGGNPPPAPGAPKTPLPSGTVIF